MEGKCKREKEETNSNANANEGGSRTSPRARTSLLKPLAQPTWCSPLLRNPSPPARGRPAAADEKLRRPVARDDERAAFATARDGSEAVAATHLQITLGETRPGILVSLLPFPTTPQNPESRQKANESRRYSGFTLVIRYQSGI